MVYEFVSEFLTGIVPNLGQFQLFFFNILHEEKNNIKRNKIVRKVVLFILSSKLYKISNTITNMF